MTKQNNNKSLEAWIWDAACAIHGAKDAGKYKDYILPLIFIKRLCDVFDDEVDELAKTIGSRTETIKSIDLDHGRVRFYIPIRPKDIENEETWNAIRSLSTNIGEELTSLIRSISEENPDLDDIINRVDYNATTRGHRELDDNRLSNLIEAISQKRLGLNDVEPDIIGKSYEYLIRKFAENSGKSGGEFFTPPEVGEIMALIMNPNPGMEIYDPACGSAGLLIKCEQVLDHKMQQAKKETFAPLTLYGQELTPDNWSMAKMNMIIHDMEGEIELGDTFNNPIFKDKSGHGIRKFDRVVANPMWNQGKKKTERLYTEETITDDVYKRFPAGFPGFNADWAWLQHIYSSLRDDGRAAVVLDTGALTRGSGDKKDAKERNVRRWFVENDLIEGVIYLPDNLFYNTTAPGIIIILNKNKPKQLKNKIFLINASQKYEKGNPKNYISPDQIKEVADKFIRKKEVEKFSQFVSKEEVVKNDYNISPSRYIFVGMEEEYRPIEEILVELKEVEEEAKKADKELRGVLKELGYKYE